MNLFVLNTVIYIYICPNIVSKLTAHKTDCPNKYFVSVQGWGGEVGGLGGGGGGGATPNHPRTSIDK